MKIPEDIYYRVLDLATALVRASEGFDREEHSTLYNELREVVDGEVASGNPHPFLFETLADFTDDDPTALDLYQRGLDYADRPDAAAYRASILLSMAERHRTMGNASMARECAGRAEEAAKLVDDPELRKQISEFLLE
ncbi:hypothetical protein HNQ60_005054 [Povalibacter uvarum]|uniref:Tetratricopeptide repeat protein n=1 Tax=Povalibacter uvarum TaxID=732238 RepID=A0A841HTP3_9GAMM|nr:hypothetical protein [Povalibacter uvarum]MBB6096163.1 hypothetical protein [Povalibacter uvarum]